MVWHMVISTKRGTVAALSRLIGGKNTHREDDFGAET